MQVWFIKKIPLQKTFDSWIQVKKSICIAYSYVSYFTEPWFEQTLEQLKQIFRLEVSQAGMSKKEDRDILLLRYNLLCSFKLRKSKLVIQNSYFR